MRIPSGMTEQETLKVIEKVCNKLASKIIFGYNSKDDIRQEVAIICLEGLNEFDSTRGTLYQFLLIFSKRRLLNLKRKTYERIYTECTHCDDNSCKLCFKRENREDNKKALFNSATDGYIPVTIDDHMSKEMMDRIDKELPADLRPIYLKLLAGHTVTQSRKQDLRRYIEEIIYDNK